MTASKEDYLEAILDYEDSDGKTRSIDIARALNVSRPSVNKSLSVLKESGLVEHERYGEVSLTKEGRAVAKYVRERHNTLKLFLTDVLKIPEETAETDACQMEHAISKITADNLKKYMQKLLPKKMAAVNGNKKASPKKTPASAPSPRASAKKPADAAPGASRKKKDAEK